MTRGELYRVFRGARPDPRNFRVYVIVSRQELIDSTHSSVVCAPIFTSSVGLATEVPVGIEVGLKHDSAIHCDDLRSVLKAQLTHFVGSLSPDKLAALDVALAVALDLPVPE